MTPKQRFLEDEKSARAWQDVADSSLFARAAETAMLMLQDQLIDQAASKPEYGFQQLAGAKNFLNLLKSIGDKPKQLIHTPASRLDHNLK